MAQTRILFVNPEAASQAIVQNTLHQMHGDWQVECVRDSAEALRAMGITPFDAIVANEPVGEQPGLDLLEHARQHHPQTLRFVLTSEQSEGMRLGKAGTAHQLVAGGSHPEIALQMQLNRALELRDLLTSAAMREVVARITFLPSAPAAYQELLDGLNSETSTVEHVGEILERDPAISSKLLQMVNSAFFGLGCRVTNPVRAISLLGLEVVKALVLSAGVYANLPPAVAARNEVSWLWRHSIRVSRMAQKVAQAFSSDARLIDDAFIAGLLHDLGTLILLCDCPKEFKEIELAATAERAPVWSAERTRLGVTHAEIGAYLLGIWGLPQPVVEAVAWHHRPASCPVAGPSPLLAVHIADCVQTGCDPLHEGDRPVIDQTFVSRCGYAGETGRFVDCCREITLSPRR